MSNIEYILNNLITEREKDIYLMRLDKIKYDDIAKKHKISNPRAQQIFRRTDEKVKECLLRFKDIKCSEFKKII